MECCKIQSRSLVVFYKRSTEQGLKRNKSKIVVKKSKFEILQFVTSHAHFHDIAVIIYLPMLYYHYYYF